MATGGSNKKVANSLVAMGSAAVMAVYAAGYARTRPAAEKIAASAMERRIEREDPPSAVAAPPAGALPAPAAPVVRMDRKSKTFRAPEPAQPPSTPPPAITEAPPPAEAVTPVPDPPPLPAPVAAVSATAPTVPAPPAALGWRDGKYQGWGSCRHGDIQATVVIEAGKIASAKISECQTRYPCDMIEVLEGQVVIRQTANVRRIAGATESSDAFYWAVTEALKQAK